MIGLNDRQNEACSYTEGPLLILAGAGSGKTRVITHRIAHLINDEGVDPYNILAITFTNKAASEMRERVDNLIGDGAERIWVSTFHSMCVRILRRFYDQINGKNNFSIYDTSDQKAVMKEVLKTLELDPKLYPERGVLAAISKAKEEFLTPEDLDKQAGTNIREVNKARCYREYQRRLRSNNALDFDDLIFETIRLFVEKPDILGIYQDRFRYIMVDEYQDTNHSQFLLVKLLADGYRNLCVVGDDDQSIYKFRGANIYNILNFEDEYKDAKVVKLEQNYRSTKKILAAANAVIANNTGRKEKALWTDNIEGDLIIYESFDNEYEEAMGVVNHILDERNAGRALSDMAVLYRTNNQSRVIEEKLIFANVPYRIYGSMGFYARREIMDLVGYLKCIANPEDDISLRRIINVPRRGIGDTSIDRLSLLAYEAGVGMYDLCLDEERLSAVGRAKEKIADFIKMMQSFRGLAADGDLIELYDEILEKTGYMVQLKAEGTDEANGRIENLKELRSKIGDYVERADEPTLEGLLEEIALVADTDQDAIDDEGTVTLMTLHSAKGLEFPVVFMVGMEERLFPSGLSIDSDDPDAVEEERRLCYVGITRAREQLYMSRSSSRMINGSRMYSSESRFMQELPAELLKSNSSRRRGSIGESALQGQNSYRATYSFGTGQQSAQHSKPQVTKGIGALSGISRGIPSAGGGDFDYEVGDQVKHIKYGKGVVLSKVKGGSDYEVVVDFEKVGEKRMFASLAKLRKV